MAHTGITRFPVVARNAEHELLGLIALDDLLKARSQNLDAERRRERVLRMRFPLPLSFFGRKTGVGTDESDPPEAA
jgi:CBS domain containing-hemolysin-like protein